MNLGSHLVQRMLRLPPPTTRDVVVERDLRVPMRDGAVLLADRWAPRTGGEGLPTALVRTPYGRAGVFGATLARPLAERGYQVLIQSTRGGFGSGGDFDPLRREREDGLDTVGWVVKQPWFGDAIVLYGGSYLGFVQWAMADQLPPQVKAMVPSVSESAVTVEFLRADGFSLETPFNWGVMTATQERRFAALRQPLALRRHRRALATVPLSRADVAAVGHLVPYIQEILADDATKHWADIDHSHRVADITVPVCSTGGWFDIFLPGQLRDFRALRDAGREARLTIGPWSHVAPLMSRVTTHDMLTFGLAHARGEPPAESTPDRYRYDPADPTPALGGVRMSLGVKASRVDNATLEARPDVLTYTTSVLDEDVEVIGDVSAEIWFRSNRSHADVFVRLCDVQVSSGAFPRFNRNPGTGEPRASATTLLAADQEVHLDATHPSAIVLPVSP